MSQQTPIRDEDFPKIFRAEQKENFITQMKQANTFKGKGDELFQDEHIELILEEVENGDCDLTDARVAIEKYVISELARNPDNRIFQRLSDAIRPIIDEVIQIEVKMYGAPKYIVSKENANAAVWRTDGHAPMGSVSIPQDIVSEVQSYGFTSVMPGEIPSLPDSPPDINEERNAFFDPLVTEEEVPVQEFEEQWLENFTAEAAYDLIDRALYLCGFHNQVSIATTDALLSYCLYGTVGDRDVRGEKALQYERECDITEPEVTPDQYIFTARNSSLRALFTMLMLTSSNAIDFKAYIAQQVETNTYNFDFNEDLTDSEHRQWLHDEILRILAKMYGKHPIFHSDLPFIKCMLCYLDEDIARHFYVALNDWASYYEERGFLQSMENCYALKQFLGEDRDFTEPEVPEESETEETASGEDEVEAQGPVVIDNNGPVIV